ncbi:MAG: RluA family pseudouridine synthase [Deltaproteobacteria bacterium]|nr:RluA family pseudouridine synthase [Deltaproteobacteria bacterium]
MTTPHELPEPLVLAVAPHESGMRLDAWLVARIEGMSRARATDHLTDGHVTLVQGPKNAKLKPSLQVNKTMVLRVAVQPRPELSAEPEALPLTILYEDDDLLVLDKPPGLVVHPAAGHESGTLVNALLHHAPQMQGLGGVEVRPGLVHRIDKDTSGLLVVSKNERSMQKLAADFAAHRLERRYVAIALGNLPEAQLTVRSLHGRHPVDRKKFSGRVKEGKAAVSHFTVLARSPLTTLVVCTLETGRTHQIRMHLAEMGHPIAGDALYGGQRSHPRTERTARDLPWLAKIQRQALHAYARGFRHPRTGEMLRFVLDWPADLLEVARGLYGDDAALPGLDQAVWQGGPAVPKS